MSNIKNAKNKSKAITTKQESVYEMIESRKATFQKLLPQNSNAEKFVSACLIAVKQDPKLQQCNVGSLIKAMMESARFGLEPNSPLSEAALVPYGDKVNFLVQYRGLLKLAWNSGLVKSIEYDKVCENDVFEYSKGFNATFRHVPSISGDRGEILAYYAFAELTDGGQVVTVMTKKEIEMHMKRYSKGYTAKNSPWATDFDAMAIKTVLRQLVDKKIPKSTEIQSRSLLFQASDIDDIPQDKRDKYMEVIIDEPSLLDVESEKTAVESTDKPF